MQPWTVALLLAPAVMAEFNLLILHTNDMHARFEQTSRISSKCNSKDVAANNCYGGFARVAHVVNQAREDARTGKGPPVLFLNAGDNYQGTIWYSVHKWKIVANLTSMLRFDAMALGNHEFDDGVSGLVPFIKKVNYPVIAANLDTTTEPSLAATRLEKSVVLTMAGNKKVGIIGYLTPETKDIAQPGLVQFKDEVESVRLEAARLKAEGVDILIALGHSGFTVDQRIAAEVPDIDVVVGGHTNTFLYTGTPPDPLDVAHGLYPTMVNRGVRKIPVVQAYAYTKYIGRLMVTFDNNGEVLKATGNPVLLNNNIPQDKRILDALDVWRQGVLVQSKMRLGTTKVYLRGDRQFCRMGECNLGNFVTDAMINYFITTNVNHEMGWTEAPIAIMNGGSIRADIDVSKEADNDTAGGISMADVLNTIPFENSLVFVKILGKHLLEALEWSVSKYDPKGTDAPGGFLQVAGMRVNYDICLPKNKRVVSVMVRCGECRTPEYAELEPDKRYGVLMPSYLAQGGDGYNFKNHFLVHRILDTTDSGVLAKYVEKLTPIYPGIEGRLLINTKCGVKYARNNAHSLRMQMSFMNVCLSILIATIITRSVS